MEDDDSIFNADLFDSEADRSVTNRPVADRSVADRPLSNRPVTDRPVADRSVTDRPVSNRPMTDRPVSDRSVTDRSLVDRSLIERSYSGYLDRSVANRSVADHSHANRSLVDQLLFEMPDRSSDDNRYDNISSNIFYYIRILETYIIFDIYKLLLLLSQGRNYRGTRAGLYKQQERFMRYRLSSAHYNWGRRGRRRYAYLFINVIGFLMRQLNMKVNKDI